MLRRVPYRARCKSISRAITKQGLSVYSQRFASTSKVTSPTVSENEAFPEKLSVRSYAEIVRDMNARKNNYLEKINTNDHDLKGWTVNSGNGTDQQMYLSSLSEGDLIETNSGNVAVILQIPDYISTFSYSIVDHQGVVSLANPSEFIFRVPKFCASPISLADTIRVLDDSDPMHPVVSVTQNTRSFLCPKIKALVESSHHISESVATELENIFLELQESGEPVNLSLFEVAWYVEEALIKRSKQGNAYAGHTTKVSKEQYSSLKGVFPPQSTEGSKKRKVSNEVLYAVFSSVRTKFSTKVLFDSNERFIPTILTLIPFSLENEHNRALDALRIATMRYNDPFVRNLEKVIESGSSSKKEKLVLPLFQASLNKSANSTITNLTKPNQEIINVIKRYAVGDLNASDWSSHSIVAMFLRKFQKFADIKINSSVAFEFLQDISVFKKWDNPIRSQSKLLPLEVETQKLAYENEPKSLSDNMESLRQDFDLPVYCIDDAGAHEIDDGLSVGNTHQRIWKIYIHIADPASGVNLEDPLVQHAYRQTSTAYYPENVIPLFPKWFTNSLGLVSDGNPRRCLTFEINYDSVSKKFDLESMEVSPRLAKRVVQITYDQVDKIIQESDHVDKTVLQDINNLHTVASAFSEYRFQHGALGLSLARPVVKLQNYPDATDLMVKSDDQNFKIDVNLPKMSTARDIVAELMIMCNHATALYTQERGISGIYRTQSIMLCTGDAEKQFHDIVDRQTLKPPGKGLGKTLDIRDSLSLLNRIRPAGLSVDPQPHAALGLDLYTQTTSPLRRFQDVLCHWQIERFLLNEPTSMFDTSQMDTMAVRLMRNQGLLKRASSQSNLFWTLRKIEIITSLSDLTRVGKDSSPTALFECIITSRAIGRVQNAYCINWGIPVIVEVKQGATPLEIGQKISCTCSSIDSSRLSITLAPLSERGQTD